jgi:ABC-2 type transport system permease protein
MSRIVTIARRELRGYFDQPTAYVLIVAFLGITLFLAYRTMYAASIASLRPIFDLLPVLFAVFVPAATMRSLAEERRGKTLDWLMAQPINEAELVTGKFLGNWAFVLLALAGTVPTAVGILAVSDADPGIVVAQYVGAVLLAGQLTAVGLWASAITRNQITAFIVASAVSFSLFLIGLPIVQIGLPPTIAGAVGREPLRERGPRGRRPAGRALLRVDVRALPHAGLERGLGGAAQPCARRIRSPPHRRGDRDGPRAGPQPRRKQDPRPHRPDA